MEPQELLTRLAEFFGVEPDAATVLDQLMQAQEQLGQMSEDDQMAMQMRTALDVDTNEAMKSRLEDIIGMVQKMIDDDADEGDEEPEEDDPPPRNFAALKSANGAFLALAEQPQLSTLPHATRNGNGNQPQPPGKKSKRYSPINQTGKAAKPTLMGMIRDVKAGKAQSYQTGPQGGFILRHEIADEIIPDLRASIPLFDMGVDQQDMTGVETLSLPKKTAGSTAYWVGEAAQVPDSEETYGNITLLAKPLAARIIVANKMLQNTTVAYEQQLREDMVYRHRNAIMTAALLGTGGVSGSNVGAQPTGLLNISGVTQTNLATNGAKPTLKNMNDAIGRIEDANVEMTNSWAWLFSPRTKRTFTEMTDNNGLPILRQDWRSGEEQGLLGLNWYTSTIVPNNISHGTSSAASYVFLGDWQYMVVAMSSNIEIMVLDQLRGDYLQTVLVAYTYVDIAVHYTEAFEVLTGVTA